MCVVFFYKRESRGAGVICFQLIWITIETYFIGICLLLQVG